MSSARGAAVEVALFGCAVNLLAPGSSRYIPAAGSQRLEDGIEVLNNFARAADHLAIAPLQSPDAAAGADIHVGNPARLEGLRAPDIVDVVRVAAVDEDVAGLHTGGEFVDEPVDRRGRHHQPGGARRGQLADEFVKGSRHSGAFGGQILHGRGALVEYDTLMSPALEAPYDVGSHAAEADHSELH